MADIVWEAQNEFLSAWWYADGSFLLQSAAGGPVWRSAKVASQEDGPVDEGHVWLRTDRSICEEYPARFKVVETHQGSLRVALLGRDGQPAGAFTLRLRLDGEWLEVVIEDVEETLPSLVYPPALAATSLVLPRNVGQWLRVPVNGQKWLLYPAHLNMRFFGGLDDRAESGWMAVLHEGYADGGIHLSGMNAAPAWLQSLEQWQGQRVLRYRLTSGGYVGMAKAYRAYAIQQGLFRSLKDKIAETPALDNLRGGSLLSIYQAETQAAERYEDTFHAVPEGLETGQPALKVYVTHRHAAQIIREALAAGMRRGLVVLRGWGRGGYDEMHPDLWPPEPALGSEDELRDVLSQGDPLLVALHDNYQDTYRQSPSFPQGVIRTRAGRLMTGGYWAGGQAYILNARDGLEYGRRNWQHIRGLNPRAMFIDTTATVQWYESYEPGNTLSRAQDEASKIALLQFYRAQGQVVGSEEGSDFAVPYVDWIENRHQRAVGKSSALGQTIPLWPLVFHDAAFCYRYTVGDPSPSPSGDRNRAPRYLADLLWGYPLIWAFGHHDNGQSGQWKQELGEAQVVADWHARVGVEEMVSHRFLTEDGAAEETVFANGQAVWVNFAGEPREIEGVSLPAYGYIFRA